MPNTPSNRELLADKVKFLKDTAERMRPAGVLYLRQWASKIEAMQPGLTARRIPAHLIGLDATDLQLAAAELRTAADAIGVPA